MFDNFEYLKNEELKNWSTVKIGGNAKYIVFPRNFFELKEIFKICEQNKLQHFILGNGSNVLFDDNGFDGVIVSLKNFNKIKRIGETKVCVGAGVNLFTLNQRLRNYSLGGLEWSYGIPATIGGFLAMNGGCFGHEICEFVDQILVLENDRLRIYKREEIDFSYRHCGLRGSSVIVLVWINLHKERLENIEKNMNENISKKRLSQPCEYPSLGSVYKRIFQDGEIIYPAKLIDKLGLKGVKIGRAQISEKHAGFIVNLGGATSADFVSLMKLIEEKVKEIGVCLKSEIIILR